MANWKSSRCKYFCCMVIVLVVFSCAYIIYDVGKHPCFRMAMNIWPGYSHHTFLALEKNLFEQEGVFVEVNLFGEYFDSLESFRVDGFDAFFGAYSDAILLRAQGYPVKVVYVSDFSNGGDVIISQSEIKSFEDLRGKVIGVSKLNSFSHLFVLSLLIKNGLNESDVNIVEVEGVDVLDALNLGKIDAGHTMEPFQTMAINQGYNLLASSADIPNSIIDVLIVKEDVVNNNPKQIKRVVRALFKSERCLVERPYESYSYISEKTGISPYELNKELRGIKILTEQENRNIFDKTINDSLYAKGEFIINFFIDKGMIEKPIDLDDLIDDEFVV